MRSDVGSVTEKGEKIFNYHKKTDGITLSGKLTKTIAAGG